MTAAAEPHDTADGDQWRLFIALEVPQGVRDAVAQAIAPFVAAHNDHLRFAPADTWHVTLAFLGPVDPSWADRLEDTIGAVAALQGSFEVRLGRAGRFGRGILFVGLDDPSYAAVRGLGQHVRDGLDRIGIDHDRRPLHPHLTLARPHDVSVRGISRNRLVEVDEALADVQPRAWRARTVTLLRTHVTDVDGARAVRHEPLARVALSP